MYQDVRDFIECVETGRQPEMNVREAAAHVEVILAGYVSAARGEPVSLPLPRD
jgi:predicted dehydrogenase